MTGKTHASVGVCGAAFLLVPNFDIKTSLIGLGFVVLGSYATDADLEVSKAGQIITDAVYGVIVLAALYLMLTYKFGYDVLALIGPNMPSQLKLLGCSLIVGSIIVGRITGHRKYMHSLIGFAIINAGVWLISSNFVIWFGLGYALHMIIDLINEKPESLLFPFHQGNICFSICKSSGIANWIISTASYAGLLYKIVLLYNIGYFQQIFIK